MEGKLEYRSIESIPDDAGFTRYDLEKVGELQDRSDPDRKYILFTDPKGGGWYETKVRIYGKWISQEENIFGRRVRRK